MKTFIYTVVVAAAGFLLAAYLFLTFYWALQFTRAEADPGQFCWDRGYTMERIKL